MRKRNPWILTISLICLLLSACGQQSVLPESVLPTEPVPVVTEQISRETEFQPDPTEPQPQETLPPETTLPEGEPEDVAFVKLTDYIPDVVVELKYGTAENFTGKQIYTFEDCYLRYGTVKKLMAVQEALRDQGLGLKVWDGFRPVSAQFALWEVCPDPTYVANPNTGFSSHSRGNTVDVTVVDAAGKELAMPIGFDDFSALADRDYSDCAEEAAQNARLLQRLMEENGFKPYFGEWWHFSDTLQYEVEEVFDPALVSQWYARCEEFITLRTAPDTGTEAITRIPVGGEFTLLGYTGDFSMVEYQGQVGYVLTSYTAPVE